MEFQLTDEQKQLREEVRKFAEEEIRPVATEYDVEEEYPYEVMDKAADMGLLAPHVPVEYGGVGYSSVENAILTEELFAADPGIGLCVSSAGFGAEALMEFGTDEQKERVLPEVTAGDAVMGSAISEPQAGSDVTSRPPRAEKDGDEWVINGSKMWITNGTVADYFVVVCETDPEIDDRYSGYSQILVEGDRDGLTRDKITGKLGIRASDTAELRFDDVRVPDENLIGQRGMGFLQLMQFFDDETRTAVAAQGVGIARGAAERALEYAEEREQFDRPISDFQAIKHKLAEMHTNTEAARWLAHLPLRVGGRQRIGRSHCARVDGQGVRLPDRGGGRQRGGPGPRRRRLRQRPRRRTALPRREDHPDLRGDHGDPEEHHRPRTPRRGGMRPDSLRPITPRCISSRPS